MAIAGMETELGEYRLERKLAIGGMAEVYAAVPADPAAHGDAERVVVKRLLPMHRSDPAYVKLFMDEARLCVKLRHPNIVRTFKAFKKGLDFYMIQELADGGSLAGLVDQLRARGERLPVPATAAVIVGLLKALDYVHRARLGDQHVRLVHRDVNPGNLLLGTAGQVKLTDFGVAEGEGMGAKRVEGALRGTPPYMAPEQVRGQNVDPRTDVFSTAVVFWELLTGRDLFASDVEYETLQRVVEHVAEPPSQLNPESPVALDAVLAKALQKNPDERFKSATAFGRALVEVGKAQGWGAGDAGLLGQIVTGAQQP